MKISVISTVLNEEKNIKCFIKSLLHQTKKPDKIIVVDGGSKDKTYEILKKISKKNKILKIFQKNGTNISQGRNYAIKKTKNQVIVSADAGGEYKKDWLEKLIKGFNKNVGFGTDKPLIKNDFQKVLAKKILHKNVCGSSRNMIFSKKIWREAGKYPEDIERGEDTLFDERIKSLGYKIPKISDAICYWEMRENLKQVRKQYYEYGYWDGIVYKKHRTLPIKHKIAIVGFTILLPFYPLLWIFSKLSLSFKIDFVRRFAYLRGFWEGFLGIKK